MCLQYAKRDDNGPVNDEKRASRPRFRPKLIRMHAAQPFFAYLFRASLGTTHRESNRHSPGPDTTCEQADVTSLL